MVSFLKKVFQKYTGDSQYKKNVAIMVTGRVVSQVIPILITPILTRIYLPSEFGIFGVYGTIVAIIAMISNGRYCLAIILPKDDKDADGLVFLSFFLTFIVSFALFIFFLFFRHWFFDILNSPVISEYFIFVVLNILFIGFHEALFYLGLRHKKYKILAWDVVWYALILVFLRIMFGVLGMTEIGLMASYTFAYLFSFVYLFVRLEYHNKVNSFGYFLSKLKNEVVKYIKFPKYSLLADSLGTFSQMSPNLFLNRFFGSVVTGYYSMTEKVLGSPIWLITSSVGDVFKQEASEQFRRNGDCTTVLVKTAKSLFFVGVIPFAILFIVSPYLIPFILGPEWSQVSRYIQILTPMYFFKFVVNPISYIVYIVNKQSYNIFFQSMKFVSMVIALYLGYYYNSVDLGLIFWSALTSLTYILVFFITLKLSEGVKNV